MPFIINIGCVGTTTTATISIVYRRPAGPGLPGVGPRGTRIWSMNESYGVVWLPRDRLPDYARRPCNIYEPRSIVYLFHALVVVVVVVVAA